MSDWDDLGEEARSHALQHGPQCGILRMILRLPEVDRLGVLAVVEDPEVPAASLRRALVKRLGDKAPPVYSITRHRRGECNCNRKGKQ